MIHFRPLTIATMVASALAAGSIATVNAKPVKSHSFNSADSAEKTAEKLSIAGLATLATHQQKALAAAPTVSGMKNQFDAQLGKATFLWRSMQQKAPDMGLIALEQRNQYAADYYLNALIGVGNSTAVTKKTGSQAVLRDMHDTQRGGIIAKYKQQINGIDVFNREYNVMMDREFNLVAGSGYFAENNSIMKNQTNAFGSAPAALLKAFSVRGGSATAIKLNPVNKTNNAAYNQYTADNSGNDGLQLVGEPRAKKVFFEKKGRLIPAYYIEIETAQKDTVDSQLVAYVVGAKTNDVLFNMDLTAHSEEFNYRVYAEVEAPNHPWDGPHGNVIPAQGADQVDSITYLDAPMVTLRSGPISTRDPWLHEQATETVGNNAIAYLDAIAPDGLSYGDYVAKTTSHKTFDYPYDTSKAEYSVHNRKGAIVNLFYMNNYLHDLYYDHGFDEKSGNAQYDNYDRGGEEHDPLRVEVQDYSGFNNANMSTPADGASPRMQMFLWTKPESDKIYGGVNVTSHGDIGMLTEVQQAGFGPQEFTLTGELVQLIDGFEDADAGNTTLDGCEAAVNADALVGKIAIVDRGACNFTAKALSAQNAGAIGILVANNRDGNVPSSMGGSDAAVIIPSLGITQDDGVALNALLSASETVTLEISGARVPFRASSWDNGVVAHEWGHYITNRLIGNATGLFNNQGRSMGEGWGDFHALLLLSGAEDQLLPGNDQYQKAYADGSYVSSFYNGIRRYPYSTDREVNPASFDDIAENAAVHSSGAVWGVHLWDAFVGLINAHGYDIALNRMMGYLVASYKMTPIGPTMTEARDALLAAAYANDHADYETILAAFAARGMGLGAVSPDRSSTDHVGVVESFSTNLTALNITHHDLDVNYEGLQSGFCSNDDILDVGETGTLSVGVKNNGNTAFEAMRVQIEVTSGQSVTFANGGIINLDALGVTGRVHSSEIEFTLNDAATADKLEFKLTFPDVAADVAADYTFAIDVNMDFDERTPVNFGDNDDMESISSLHDFRENVMAGQGAVGTRMLDNALVSDFADIDIDLGQQYLFIRNNSFPADVGVQTRPIQVGFNGNFSVSWFHFFAFEENWDAGYVEASVNGGRWLDVTTLGGVFTGSGYVGGTQSLPERPSFTGRGLGFEGVDFGASLNGNEVAFRFRVMSDDVAADIGWVIDGVSFTNIESPVYSNLVAGNTFACDNRPPMVTAVSNNMTVEQGANVTLSVDALDVNGDALTYHWRQLEGDSVTLEGADTATATFTAPVLPADDNTLVFSVMVSDGMDRVMRKVEVTVEAVLIDSDGDGTPDDIDNCPAISNEDQLNTDGANDGGNACDTDDDNDGVLDVDDDFPLDPTRSDANLIADLVFVDANLSVCVKSTAQANGWTKIDEMDSLNCSDKSISDLTGLAQLTGLTELLLSTNQITDISAVSSLTALVSLDLRRNTISDISSLASLSSLTQLKLAQNAVSDLSPLANLTALNFLSLSANPFGDVMLTALSQLNNLNVLYLRDNEMVDLSALANLTSLTKLYLRNNLIVDVSVLANLTNLTIVQLNNNKIVDIAALFDLVEATNIDLRDNTGITCTSLDLLETKLGAGVVRRPTTCEPGIVLLGTSFNP